MSPKAKEGEERSYESVILVGKFIKEKAGG